MSQVTTLSGVSYACTTIDETAVQRAYFTGVTSGVSTAALHGFQCDQSIDHAWSRLGGSGL